MSELQSKFKDSDTEKRTKVAQEIVDVENSYNREIEALRGEKKVIPGKKVATIEPILEAESKIEEKKEVLDNKELKENKKELNLEEISLFAKAEAGILLNPQAIRDEIERLKQEIKNDNDTLLYNYESLQFGDDKKLNKGIIDKENKIRKLEIILIDTENKIKNDYEKVGPNNVALIMAQEESIIKSLKDLKSNDLSLVPKARNLMHQWNVADSQDYFANEQKIKEALTIVSQAEIVEKSLGDQTKVEEKEVIVEDEFAKEGIVEEKILDSATSLDDKVEYLNSVGDVEEALKFNEDLSKKEKAPVDLSMFDDMQKIAYFNEPRKNLNNNEIEYQQTGESEQEFSEAENTQEKTDKKKRAGIFEAIRKNKKLKWLVMALGLTAIGFGIFKGIDKNNDKKKDNTENKINTNDREEINPDDTIVLTPDDFNPAEKADKVKIFDDLKAQGLGGEIFDRINPDVLDTIIDEVGGIHRAVVLEKGDGVGLINDYKMHNSYKVNFIDGETGAIHRDLEAISRTVQPGDLVIENVNGEIFVICFHGIHDSGKTGYEGLSNNVEVDSESGNDVVPENTVEQNVSQANVETTAGDSTIKNNIEVKTNVVDVPADSSNNEVISNNPEVDFNNLPIIDLNDDYKKYKQNQKDSVDNKTVVSEDSSDVETKVVPEKTKKNFLQRLFSPKEKKVEQDTVSKGVEIATEKIVVSEPVKVDTLNVNNNIQQKDTVVEKTNVSEPIKIDILKTDDDIKQKETIVKKDTVLKDGSMGISQRINLNIPKDLKDDNQEYDKDVLNPSDFQDAPRSGMQFVEKRFPGSGEEEKRYKIGSEAGLRSEDLTIAKEDVVEDGVGPADNEQVKTNKKDVKKKTGKVYSPAKINPQDFAVKMKDGKVKGIPFYEQKIKIDKDTIVAVNQVVDSLKTVGVFETTSYSKDSIATAPEVVKATEVKSEPGYIMEKTERRAEVAPGQIKATLTLKRVEGGWLVKNSNGTYSTTTIDDSAMPQFTKLAEGTEIVYVKNPDNTWSEVVFETGK